jgi:hypothetical protein
MTEPLPLAVGAACYVCGHTLTERNRRWFMVFRGKPLCARWKACYRRRTGKTVRMPKPRRSSLHIVRHLLLPYRDSDGELNYGD